MTVAQIEKRKMEEARKYEIAKAIRSLLDAARKEYGPTAWDEDDMDSQVQELVFGE